MQSPARYSRVYYPYQSVETSWSPLTPEHGFPSLLAYRHRALPL